MLQFLHQLALAQHLAGQVVLGGVHVVAAGHGGHGKGQAAAELIAVAQLPQPLQVWAGDGAHLQAAELGVQAHHGAAGQQHPEVVVGEAEQQGELARPLHFGHDHRRGYLALELGCLEAHQGALAGELQRQGEFVGQGFLRLGLQNPQQAPLLPQPGALVFVGLEVFPGDVF